MTAPTARTTSLTPHDRSAGNNGFRENPTVVPQILQTVPELPYILTIPYEPRFQYHPHTSMAQNWRAGTTFARDEQHLDYCSYMYRDPANSCIIPRAGFEFEQPKPKQLNGFQSRPNTPLLGSAVKKISLSAYKNREKASPIPAVNGASVQEPTQTEPAKPVDKKQVNEGVQDKKERQAGSGAVIPDKVPAKEGNEHTLPDKERLRDKAQARHDTPLTQKKQEPSPSELVLNSFHAKEAPKGKGKPIGKLPDMLSPGDLPTPFGLPNLITPKLPTWVEEQMGKRKHTPADVSLSSEKKQPPIGSQGSSVNGQVSASQTPPQETPTKSVVKATGSKRPPDQVSGADPEVLPVKRPKLSEPEASNANNVTARKPSINSVPSHVAQRIPKKALPASSNAATEPETSLVVILKYKPKKLGKVISSLVKLRASKAPARLSPSTQDAPSTNEKESEVDSTVEMTKKKQEDMSRHEPSRKKQLPTTNAELRKVDAEGLEKKSSKRSLEEADQTVLPATKRRAPPAIDADRSVSTPVEQAFQSPAMPKPPSAQKPHLLTPGKPVVAMRRMNSSDSSSTTPQVLGQTPTGGVEPLATGGSSVDAKAWRQEINRLTEIGRELKHSAARAVAQKDLTKIQKKPAAAMAVESFLVFIASSCAKEAYFRVSNQPISTEIWEQVLLLARLFETMCMDFSHLRGLIHHLVHFINCRIVSILTSQPYFDPSAQKDLPAKQAATLAQAVSANVRSSVEAYDKLGIDALQLYFPNTWMARANPQDWRAVWKEQLEPTKYAGPYVFPLDERVTGIQAFRFGQAVLREWVQAEHVDYEFKLALN